MNDSNLKNKYRAKTKQGISRGESTFYSFYPILCSPHKYKYCFGYLSFLPLLSASKWLTSKFLKLLMKFDHLLIYCNFRCAIPKINWDGKYFSIKIDHPFS